MSTERSNPLAGFWDSSFPFTEAVHPPAPATPPATALTELGASGIKYGGRDLAAVLAPAYDRFTHRD
ncbi:hypothetical protein CFP65_3329 [Kitasatospora sp. MMS16-BH015]|uniref:hypothetical protein n=1 Tax=Kitasatospora sp. MMS16-BH015 TaxID=2018025 RepID=UPI000CA2D26F|nr:hypothetical protein [Kitasatospora sp. MMS16-BH015]AUG78128.1 hypothetical protein CFP65_3329 [Kitasatospora sp. MMS16-BH015]